MRTILSFRLKDGRDALPIALQRLENPLEREMLERHNVLPYCTGHWVEFYPRYMRLAEPYQDRVQGLAMYMVIVYATCQMMPNERACGSGMC